MPTYVYQCLQCRHALDVSHSIHESPKFPCPQCGGFTRRVVGGVPPVVMKHFSPPPPEESYQKEGTAHQCHPTCALHYYIPPVEDDGTPSLKG